MRKIFYIYIFLVLGILCLDGCSENIGINDFTYQCETDNDCKEGYVCDRVRGCIKLGKDAGIDGSIDVVDIKDFSDIVDLQDVIDVEDVQEVEDMEDIGEGVFDGGEDIDDAGGDVFDDISDISQQEDISDVGEDIIEEDAGVDIGDAGDGGVDTGINYLLRLESIYDSSAGICSSPNYILESVTGFSASEIMRSNNYILHKNVLFKK